MKIKSEKICFSIFIVFYCLFLLSLSLPLSLCLSVLDCFVVDVDVGSGVVLLIQMSECCYPSHGDADSPFSAFLLALFAHTLSLARSPALSPFFTGHTPHSSGVGVLRQNKNRKNQERD